MRARHVFSLIIASAVLFACVKVPYTNRRSLRLIPDPMMNMLGKQTYRSMLSDVRVERGTENSRVLERVGQRISRVADEPRYDWQFSLIADNTVNAWCLPGGYIGFYTGILPVLQNEAGMAFVMGHEVGHATARHGAERLSQSLAVLGGIGGLALLLETNQKMTPQQRQIVLGALGVGATVGVILPFSRSNESEADIIGVMYMASAGYPPEESVKVWQRMSRVSGGGGGLAFLSTHPSNERRIAVLQEWMPKARKRQARNPIAGNTQQQLWR